MNPIKTSSMIVIEKYGRKVALDVFREPDGSESEWLLFSSDKTPVIVLPFDTEGNIVAIRQYRYGVGETVIELPGGLIAPGENWKTCAERELLEETGYRAEDIGLLGEPIMFDPCCYAERFIPAVARGCVRVAKPTVAGGEVEHCEVSPFSFDQWLGYIRSGRICDSKTLAVTMLAQLKGPL